MHGLRSYKVHTKKQTKYYYRDFFSQIPGLDSWEARNLGSWQFRFILIYIHTYFYYWNFSFLQYIFLYLLLIYFFFLQEYHVKHLSLSEKKSSGLIKTALESTSRRFFKSSALVNLSASLSKSQVIQYTRICCH